MPTIASPKSASAVKRSTMNCQLLPPTSSPLQEGMATAENRPRTVKSLVEELASTVNLAVRDIRRVNDNTRTLSLNARIEAARAGIHGAAFGVVASEMQDLSGATAEVADLLASTTNAKISELLDLIGTNIRGTRLSDLALTNIDLIDRCLYERTCDVRWWATDNSLVQALEQQTPESHRHAAERMGVILNAYTVYFDLVLCDTHGRIIASGRPERFHSIGKNVSGSAWFTSAMETHCGDAYGFQSAHFSPLANDQPSLVYSCAVRANGQSNGKILGVLGVIFNWVGLAEPILARIPIDESERTQTHCLIVDSTEKVLASDRGCEEHAVLRLPEFSRVFSQDKGFFISDYHGQQCCIAHAKAPDLRRIQQAGTL